MNFRIVSLLTTALCMSLFVILFFVPQFIYWLFEVAPDETASFMLRRTALLFLGFSAASWFGRNSAVSEARQAISIGFCVVWFTLAVLGLFEYYFGSAGIGIWVAILGELVFGVLYLNIWFKSRSA